MKEIMKLRFVTTVLAVSVLLVACGGVDGTSIGADRLMYGNVTSFTVNGPNLDKGITLVAPKCSGITELAGSTPTKRVYNCTPTVTGPMKVTVFGGGGDTLRTSSFNIPLPQVTLKTSMGDIVLELDPGKALVSAFNFMQYVNANFYANLIFHRVIQNFMIQGGGFTTGPTPKQPTYAPIKLESNNGLNNVRGTLAMARTDATDSATSQFYINVVDNLSLDYVSDTQPGYAVFGKVVDGLPVVDAISAVPTGAVNAMTDVPLTDVVIVSAVQTR